MMLIFFRLVVFGELIIFLKQLKTIYLWKNWVVFYLITVPFHQAGVHFANYIVSKYDIEFTAIVTMEDLSYEIILAQSFLKLSINKPLIIIVKINSHLGVIESSMRVLKVSVKYLLVI